MAGYLGGSAVIGWLLVSGGLFFFIKYRSNYSEVQYAHIVGLPWTLKTYRKAKGDYWLRQGIQNAEQGLWRDAFDQLRMGLAERPEDQKARLLISRIYLMAGRPDMAQTTLLEGLPYHADHGDYLRTVISFLFGQQADQTVIEMANKLLEQPSFTGPNRRMIAIARIYAYFNRDQYQQAQAAAESEGLTQYPESQFIHARTLWETGTPESALVLLRDLHKRTPKDADIYRTLIVYLSEAKYLDEARRVALARQLYMPDDPDAYIDSISIYSAEGETDRQNSAEAEFLKHFGANPSALLKLSGFAAKKGRTELAWKIVELCPSKSSELRSAILLALDADLAARSFQEAREHLKKTSGLNLAWSVPQRISLVGLEAVAYFGLDMKTESQEDLRQVLASPAMPPAGLTALAAHFNTLGAQTEALDLLRRAVELDPLCQPALVELLQLELKSRNLDNSLDLAQRLPSLRKPPSSLMLGIIQNLESDRYLFVEARTQVIKSLQAKLDAVGASG